MRKKKIIPPADIILDVIYDAPCAEEKVLKFYDNYINSAAKEAVSGKEEFVINEDLVQDIRLAVLNALPYFRKAFGHKYLRNKVSVVLVLNNELF